MTKLYTYTIVKYIQGWYEYFTCEKAAQLILVRQFYVWLIQNVSTFRDRTFLVRTSAKKVDGIIPRYYFPVSIPFCKPTLKI